jgi:hypothetical protein
VLLEETGVHGPSEESPQDGEVGEQAGRPKAMLLESCQLFLNRHHGRLVDLRQLGLTAKPREHVRVIPIVREEQFATRFASRKASTASLSVTL